MSWSDVAGRAGVVALALSAGGCFTPLYSESAHPGLVEDMQAIDVAPINPPGRGKTSAIGLDYAEDRTDRVGHYLRDDLIFALNGTGTPRAPKYRLNVSTVESTATPTVQSQLSAADAATVTITAKYSLTPVAGGAPILSDVAASSVVYDLTAQRYANLRASRDAEIRLAKSLADEMELRIAAALANR
ncbi:MAG TPA: LPS assembly lipoprotein LptE [Roseiarcus sp.]|nr:LPS assembly lipoprotein LptE [Roseiarcus sp.]